MEREKQYTPPHVVNLPIGYLQTDWSKYKGLRSSSDQPEEIQESTLPMVHLWVVVSMLMICFPSLIFKYAFYYFLGHLKH